MKGKKVLVTTPLCIPSYFNAGHRLAIYQVAAYLRQHGYIVVVSDISALNVTWKNLTDLLVQNKFDYVVLLNDFDLIEGMSRTLQYIQEFSPDTKIVTFGRLSSMNPEFFYQFAIDGIVAEGDYEPGVLNFLKYQEKPKIYLKGVRVFNEKGNWQTPDLPGTLLPVEEWLLPNVKEITHASYDALYSSDQNKFCGIPERRELVVPMARGCPVGCNFCEVWPREGLKERRLPVKQVIEYIVESFEAEPFEYVSMYAPTFTLSKKWVLKFSDELLKLNKKYPWKCTTTMFHLNRDLVLKMGEAGCFRISVGVEALESESLENLPIHKHEAKKKLDNLIEWCNEAEIELNCFVIVGLPETTVEGTKWMFEYLRSHKVRIRPSILSDYSLLKPDMSEQEALKILGRHVLPPNTNFSHSERQALYSLVFGEEPNLTQVMDSIPKRT